MRPRAGETGADGAHGRSQCLGNLLVGQLLPGVEKQHIALLGVERRERVCESIGLGAATYVAICVSVEPVLGAEHKKLPPLAAIQPSVLVQEVGRDAQ